MYQWPVKPNCSSYMENLNQPHHTIKLFKLLPLHLNLRDTDSYKSWTYTARFTVHPPTSELFILMDEPLGFSLSFTLKAKVLKGDLCV